jgi:CRP-like cAMP-binding protein
MSDSTFFDPKSVLFREGDDASQMMIIKSGQVLCLKASKERLIPVFLANGQDIIGESAMLSGAPYTYSAIALSRVEVMSVPSKNFTDALDAAPEWLTDLTLTMISRFQSTAGLVAENRVLHPSILSEEEFPPSLEIEYKKLLSQ